MPIVINLVATRSKDGDHRALARWYHDHVHLLMGFAALQRATLYRCLADVTSGEPEYLCLYEFPSHADFTDFELSPARAQAQQVVQNGWARNGIEIVQRTQYFRLGQRFGSAERASEGAIVDIQTLGLGAGPLAGVARWLADRVYCTWCETGSGPVAWHRQCSATEVGGDALVVAEAARVDASRGAALAQARRLTVPGQEEGLGLCPSGVVLRWQGTYRRLDAWGR